MNRNKIKRFFFFNFFLLKRGNFSCDHPLLSEMSDGKPHQKFTKVQSIGGGVAAYPIRIMIIASIRLLLWAAAQKDYTFYVTY